MRERVHGWTENTAIRSALGPTNDVGVAGDWGPHGGCTTPSGRTRRTPMSPSARRADTTPDDERHHVPPPAHLRFARADVARPRRRLPGSPRTAPMRSTFRRTCGRRSRCAFAAAAAHGHSWSVNRSHAVIGPAVGNAMDLASTRATYAGVQRHLGRPFAPAHGRSGTASATSPKPACSPFSSSGPRRHRSQPTRPLPRRREPSTSALRQAPVR